MNNEDIIKIKGNKDDWYKEAVFIMNDGMIVPDSYKELSEKADTLIGNHAKKNGLRPQVKTSSPDQTLNLILASSIGVLLCLCLLLFN